MDEILKAFPETIQNKIRNTLNCNIKMKEKIEEIRVRANRPIILRYSKTEEKVEYNITSEDILQILQNVCDNSIYSYQNQICNGYITLKGGHRVGITGHVVVNKNEVINIPYIYSLNFRVARQVFDCSNKALEYILDLKNNSIYNTIIVSPPGCGKTTILRDLTRRLSSGIEDIRFNGVTVGIVDERGEIAAMYKGIPQNDVGTRTDVLDNVPKALGIKMLIRSMNPKIVVADEIGNIDDVEAINYAVCSGVKGIFTAHGSNLKDVISNPILNKLYETNIFERIITMDNERSLKLEYSVKKVV